METHAITHIGLVRPQNEDRYLVQPRPDGSLLVAVADGLGGHAAGELAARQVIATLEQAPSFGRDIERELRELACAADRTIYRKAEENPAWEGMGTTLTGVLIRDHTAYWVQVGDSRLYLVRSGATRQITTDQTMLQFLLEEKEITEEQARTHYSRHLLDQCVGQGGCRPETGRFRIERGDLLMLSSDGLHGTLDRRQLADLLQPDCGLERQAETLLQAALKNGGPDNITAVFARL